MRDGTAKREIEALRSIRHRWSLRGWHFNPLGRLCIGLGDGIEDAVGDIDSESAVIESLYALKESPLSWPSIEKYLWDACFWSGVRPVTLIEELETLFRDALVVWDQFKTVFDSEKTQRMHYRWRPYGTYPASLRKEVRDRYSELVTTSRFSVGHAVPSVRDLRMVNYPTGQIEDRHLVSLAVMVCVVRAIESLEDVLTDWRSDSRPYRSGRPFEWMAVNEQDQLEFVLVELLLKDDQGNRSFFVSKMADAAAYQRQAEAWLAHADTLFTQHQEIERVIDATKSKTVGEFTRARTFQAQNAAKKPRKGLTPALVADHWRSHPGKPPKALIQELVDQFQVSERTVTRHLKIAREGNLLS
jgi:hypothetical protein